MMDLERAAAVGAVWTFDMVEERLVEAMLLWWRAPDRERNWLTLRANWPEIVRHPGRVVVGGEFDEVAPEKTPRPLPLTRAQVAEMEAAGELLGHVVERDRRLVGLVLAFHAHNPGKRLLWASLWRKLGRGRPGPDGLRMRYSRAITSIANVLNG